MSEVACQTLLDVVVAEVSSACVSVDADRVVFGRRAEPGDLKMRDPDSFIAVVAMLEGPDLCVPDYVEFLLHCASCVARRDDFRLYVITGGTEWRDLKAAGNSDASKLLQQLEDTVQILKNADPAAAGRDLCAFLEELEHIRRMSTWRRLRLGFDDVAGRGASGVQAISAITAIGLIFWLPVWDPRASLGDFSRWEDVVAFVCAIGALPFLVVTLYVFSRHGFFPIRIWRDPGLIVGASLSSFLGPHMLGVPVRIDAPARFVVLGLVWGVLLEIARRRGYTARREMLPISLEGTAELHGRLSPHLRRQAGATWLDPWRSPLLPVTTSRVFISYARASDWGRKAAEVLEAELSQVGALFFRDTDIAPGGSWRRELNANLGRATVFIALADSRAVQRGWPAAEMEAALAGRAEAGVPEVIVLIEPGLDGPDVERWSWRPAFRAVLEQQREVAETTPHVMEFQPAVARAIAYRLHPSAYSSPATVPSALARPLSALWRLLSAMVQMLSAFGAMLGHLAFVVLALDFLGVLPARMWLSKVGWLGAAVILLSAISGHTARLALAARFQVRHVRQAGITAANRDGAVGLLTLTIWFMMSAELFVLGWAGVLLVVGFAAADEFCRARAASDPDFIAT